MPIIVFGNNFSAHDTVKKIVTSLFVQKPYLRTNYIEANTEEDFNMKNRFEIKNLPCPQKNSNAVCKSYVDNSFNDSSIIKNTAHIDLKDKHIPTQGLFKLINYLKLILI